MTRNLTALCLSLSVLAAPVAQAQTQETDAEDAVAPEELLTQAEIETLVAPVALYPDTLLVQILVASTYPLDVMKADRLLAMNQDTGQDALQAEIESQGYDSSVEVLATAFPSVVTDMATHVEWTEAMGNAMLAQSDDVMQGVQTMRKQAIDNGALISGDAQTVEVSSDDDVIIQPTDPEVVYVPQYDPQVVYADNGSDVGDALMAGAVAFGTFAVMDAIFDNDDPWNDYWGCRNCGGWGGGSGGIIRNPNIDLDVDGNVNIGNSIDLGDREWRPDDKRKRDAQHKIADRRGPEGKTKLPIDKGDSRGDALRANLSDRAGVADISRPGNRDQIANVQRPSKRPEGVKQGAIDRTKPARNGPAASKAVAHKPAVKKPAVKKPAANKQAIRKAAPARKPTAMAKRAPSHKARAASHRGGGAHKAGSRRR
ncbi:DUF3300 domain-containing protein [Sedimentitalea sp. JM2-8]|uniref:DUF3300 domain-containing protein n=1 Tax=Sedimentitalea xiamensis TaxID=3050037 RepID=A0ABT7FBL3_9RHOB|nr:DUF3300 domain-containing protein [Sedimentitalea xiamensis]MDK3072501.1 DUF3300 domain-containing protein [Sedimentitalea xiamensis]